MAKNTRLATTVTARYLPGANAVDAFYLDGRMNGLREQNFADITLDREERGAFFAVYASSHGSKLPGNGEDGNREHLMRISEALKQNNRQKIDQAINDLAECAVAVTGRLTLADKLEVQPYFAGLLIKDGEIAAVTLGRACAYLYRDDALFPLTQDDLGFKPLDYYGKTLPNMDDFSAGVAGTIRYSNIAQLKANDCIILCNREVMEIVGQQRMLQLLDQAEDQSDAAGMVMGLVTHENHHSNLQFMIGFVEDLIPLDRLGRSTLARGFAKLARETGTAPNLQGVSRNTGRMGSANPDFFANFQNAEQWKAGSTAQTQSAPEAQSVGASLAGAAVATAGVAGAALATGSVSAGSPSVSGGAVAPEVNSSMSTRPDLAQESSQFAEVANPVVGQQARPSSSQVSSNESLFEGTLEVETPAEVPVVQPESQRQETLAVPAGSVAETVPSALVEEEAIHDSAELARRLSEHVDLNQLPDDIKQMLFGAKKQVQQRFEEVQVEERQQAVKQPASSQPLFEETPNFATPTFEAPAFEAMDFSVEEEVAPETYAEEEFVAGQTMRFGAAPLQNMDQVEELSYEEAYEGDYAHRGQFIDFDDERGERGKKIALVALILVAIALICFIVYTLFGDKLFGRTAPSEVPATASAVTTQALTPTPIASDQVKPKTDSNVAAITEATTTPTPAPTLEGGETLPEGTQTYKILPNDGSLWNIVQRLYRTEDGGKIIDYIEKIRELNPDLDVEALQAGDKIVVPKQN